jgi:flagellar basal body rod protein FlgC/flagellar basal body rod protein FlgG
MFLIGCESERQVSENEHPKPPHVAQTPHPPEAHAPAAERPHPPLVFPPLRRTLASAQDTSNLDAQSLLRPSEFPLAVAVSAQLRSGGDMRLRALIAATQDSENALVSGELEKFGFKPESGSAKGERVWLREIAGGEQAPFEKALLDRMEDAARKAQQVLGAIAAARTPGQLVWRAGVTPPSCYEGRVVYTGNAMDIALAGADPGPKLFIAAEGPQAGQRVYLRGGRLVICDDCSLRLEKFRLSGDWKAVPRETEALKVRPDGIVQALLRDGNTLELGRLQVVKLASFKPAEDGVVPGENVAPECILLSDADSPLRPGHLEYARVDDLSTRASLMPFTAGYRVAAEMLRAIASAQAPQTIISTPGASAPASIVIHGDLPWAEQHLKALGVSVERIPGRMTIPAGKDMAVLTEKLAKVLEVLRVRMGVHEQNLRNAERVRDGDRISPYRRKIIKIGAQGEALEELDPTPFPKVSRPGDPNADGEGFVLLPNVNRAIETADFQSAAEEYRLIRAALERLAPQHIFPDPIPLPQKAEGQ